MTVCRASPFLGSSPEGYEWLEASEESVVTDVNLEWEQLHRSKDQCEELIEVSLVEERREA